MPCACSCKDAGIGIQGYYVPHTGLKQLGRQNAITTTDIKHALRGLGNGF
jgi:hypothetical protein